MGQKVTTQPPDNIVNFGLEFQQQLLAEVVTDKVFGMKIIEILQAEYFNNKYLNFIVKLLKEYHAKHDCIPTYKGLYIQIDNDYASHVALHKSLTDTLSRVEKCEFNNKNVQEISLNFCKFRSVSGAINGIKKKLDSGHYEEYDEIEESIKKAVTFNENDDGVDIHVGIESALRDDYRDPIPIGIGDLDIITNGGLGRGELAVIIAPLGVGKTTILSLIGSNAYLNGKNVLHIFFEDRMDEVKRKYLCHWSGVELSELTKNRDKVLLADKKVREAHPDNKLILEKLRADNITTTKLRRIIKREINKLDGKLDMIILDYADCLDGEQGKNAEEWSGEGKTMRQLEVMTEDFDVAFWTAVQGGRRSTTAAVVEVDMIGGNIKKAQVAHLIISIAKTLSQRDQKVATIAVLKSRFGGDGAIYENCPFDNGKMHVNTTVKQNFNAFKTAGTQRDITRIHDVVATLREENKQKQNNTSIN